MRDGVGKGDVLPGVGLGDDGETPSSERPCGEGWKEEQHSLSATARAGGGTTAGCSPHAFPHAEPQQKPGRAAGKAPELLLQSPEPPTSNPSAGFATAHTRLRRIWPTGDTSVLPAAQEAHDIPALGFSESGQALRPLGWGFRRCSAQHPDF